MRQVVVNDLVFGSGRMKICVPVCEKTTEAVLDAVKEIKTTPADLIEWRIDYFDEDMFAAAPEIFKAAAPLPVLCMKCDRGPWVICKLHVRGRLS